MGRRTIGEAAHGRDNNFNLLRIVAAAAVLVAHCVELSGGYDYLSAWDRLVGYSLGQTAVSLFFAVSGFFITKSFLTRRSLTDFWTARAMRIFPGLIVVVLLCALVLGPAISRLALSGYFGEPAPARFVGFNLILWPNKQWGLPGVFAGNPYGDAVDGSLWTLKWEVSCYILVMVFGLIGLLGRRTIAVVVAVALLAALLIPQAINGAGEGHYAVNLLTGAALLSLPFALGGAMYVWRDRFPLDGRLALLLVALTIAAWFVEHRAFVVLFAFALSYGSIWFGLADLPALRAYNRFGDYSYGLYIYAFPVQQTLVWAFAPGSVELLVMSLPTAILLAVLSWKLVEEPALRRRHQVGRWLTRMTGDGGATAAVRTRG